MNYEQEIQEIEKIFSQFETKDEFEPSVEDINTLISFTFNALILAKNAARELKAFDWIPCGDRLPEKEGEYLTFSRYETGYSEVNIKPFAEGEFYNGEDDCEVDKGVIAWMPLPEPYKGE